LAELYPFGEFITQGEQNTAFHLRDHLPKEWAVVSNKILVMPNRSTREVDLIVIGEHRVFVIDEKGFRGRIHGNDSYWVLDSQESLTSPLNNMEMVARKVAGYLRDQVPGLAHTVLAPFVIPMVILSDESATILIQEPRRDQIVTLQEAVQTLKVMDRRGREESVGPFRNLIMDRLRVLPPRPSLPRSINTYRIEEELTAGPHYRSFLAEHDTGGKRRLKLYELVSLPEAERSQQKDLIYRDFHALNKATAEGLAPTVDLPFMWGDDRYVVVPQHLVNAPSLRAVASEIGARPATLDEALGLAEAMLTALEKLHALGIVHRNLTPDTVYVRRGPGAGALPQVIFSDFDFARLPDENSVADAADALDWDNPYRAPELSVGLAYASAASDIYAAGLILAELFSGDSAEDIRRALAEDRPLPPLALAESGLLAEESDSLREMLASMVAQDDRQRWQRAADAREIVVDLVAARGARQRADGGAGGTALPADGALPVGQGSSKSGGGGAPADGLFQKGDLIDGQYEVERVLGAGATAVTYLVRDIHYDERSVLKTIKNPLSAKLLAGNEYQALKNLYHRTIPRVFNVWSPDHPYHIRREYVDGVPLADLSGEFPWPMDRVLSFGYDILDALALLERNGLAHRDLSARNVLVSNEGPKLIDFGLAIPAADAHQTLVGTPAYRAPELDRMQGWNPTCDTYSLGVMLFWTATGVFPFPQDMQGRYDKSQTVAVPPHAEQSVESALVFDEVLAAIRRAITPERQGRYASARDFVAALRNAAASQVRCHIEEGGRVINPWVTELQGLYRNSRVGNADNRGLDSGFAELTYVPTRLDEQLIPLVLEGRYSVLLLSGNPGDGKTAWLMQLKEELRARKGTDLTTDVNNGWRFKQAGHTFAANYDASESSKDKRADDLLNDILMPLRGDAPPRHDLKYTALIAINDGKLREFLLSNPDYGWLGKQVYRLLEQPDWTVDRRVALVDLKQRSVVGGGLGDAERNDLYEQVLLRLLDDEGWSDCEGCRARTRCPMKFNRDTLADPEIGPLVRGRLRALLQMTHLRRERHITMRDLRSALAYIVAGTSSCEDIHTEIDTGELPPGWYNRLYFMASFNPNGESEENLADFALYDPAQVTSPRLDRFLHFRRHGAGKAQLDQVMASSSLRSDQPLKAITVGSLGRSWYDAYKRRLFYEGDTERLSVSEQQLPTWAEMLPYRYFSVFLDAVTGRTSLEEVKSLLCEGISRASGVADPRLYRRFLCVRTSQNEAVDLTVFKRFPQAEFVCEVVRPKAERVEVLPNALQLTHSPSDASIAIGLDLFEILMRFTEGYEAGAEEQQPFVIDLAQFQNRLLNQTATELLLLEAGRQLHRVRQVGGEIELLTLEDEVASVAARVESVQSESGEQNEDDMGTDPSERPAEAQEWEGVTNGR